MWTRDGVHFFKDGKTMLIAICKTEYSKINIRVTKCSHFLELVTKNSM